MLLRASLKSSLELLLDIDKKLVSTNDLGALDFKSKKDYFLQLKEIVAGDLNQILCDYVSEVSGRN